MESTKASVDINFICQHCQLPLKIHSSLLEVFEGNNYQIETFLKDILLDSDVVDDNKSLCEKKDLEIDHIHNNLYDECINKEDIDIQLKLLNNSLQKITQENDSKETNFDKHTLYQRMTEFFNYLSDWNVMDHPLCQKCCEKYHSNMECPTNVINQSTFVDHSFSYHPTGPFSLNNENTMKMLTNIFIEDCKSIYEEDIKINLTISFICKKIKSIKDLIINLNEEFTNVNLQMNISNNERLDLRTEFNALSSHLQTKQQLLAKLNATCVLDVVFKISIKDNVATINDKRLGRITSTKEMVDWTEISVALGFAAFALKSVSSIMGIIFDRFEIFPIGSLSIIVDKSTNIRLPLYYNGSFRPIWDRKFEDALSAFLYCIQAIKESIEKKHPSLKFPYNINNGLIIDPVTNNSYSVRYSRCSVEDWTIALKYLATNLKWCLMYTSSVTGDIYYDE